MSSKKRKQIEELIYTRIQEMDPSGTNREIYKLLFKRLNTSQFNDWVSRIGKDFHISLVIPNGGELTVDVNNLLKLCDKYGIEIYERLLKEDDGVSYLTPNKYHIVRLAVRRSSQHATSKINIAKHNRSRNVLSGQVTGDSKSGGFSSVEAMIIGGYGMDNVLDELGGVRGGDTLALRKFNETLMDTGTVSSSQLRQFRTKSRGLKSLKYYFKGVYLNLSS